MRIKKLTLHNFRNYEDETFAFEDGLNVLTGRNAQGKTNCAEAVFYLCTGSSLRIRHDRQLIRRGESCASLRAEGESRFGTLSLEADIFENKRELRVNGVKVSKSADFLGNINSEIDRLNGIISDLLSLVSIDSGEMRLKREKFRLDDMVRDCARKLAPLARERGIELEETVRDAVEITADKSKLMQVVYNVIDNAIKYTPRAGSVHVDMARAGKRAVIRISDTGIGIPEEDQKHIFDRFYRVDKARSRETGGTGLGLSIVKQIVMLHNGTISVNSEVGKGSTFTIELPL